MHMKPSFLTFVISVHVFYYIADLRVKQCISKYNATMRQHSWYACITRCHGIYFIFILLKIVLRLTNGKQYD